VKSYFEVHSHNYFKGANFYTRLLKFLRNKNDKSTELSILDVGCGDGGFIKAVMSDPHLHASCYATDISLSMLKEAKTNINRDDVHLIVADGFALPLSGQAKFDLVHLDSVLHHLIRQDRKQSNRAIVSMLKLLNEMLKPNGELLVEEVYYDSFLFPHLTSSFIFHSLKLINSLHLDLRRIMPELIPDLEVNFLNRKQLTEILSGFGKVTVLQQTPWKIPKSYGLFLLRSFGHITLRVQSTLR